MRSIHVSAVISFAAGHRLTFQMKPVPEFANELCRTATSAASFSMLPETFRRWSLGSDVFVMKTECRRNRTCSRLRAALATKSRSTALPSKFCKWSFKWYRLGSAADNASQSSSMSLVMLVMVHKVVSYFATLVRRMRQCHAVET